MAKLQPSGYQHSKSHWPWVRIYSIGGNSIEIEYPHLRLHLRPDGGIELNPGDYGIAGRRDEGEARRLGARRALIWGDRILLNIVPNTGTIQIYCHDDSNLIATLQPVPLQDHEWGWIAYTSDSQWDASPGAEHYVWIYVDNVRQSDDFVADKRVPGLLRKMLAKVDESQLPNAGR